MNQILDKHSAFKRYLTIILWILLESTLIAQSDEFIFSNLNRENNKLNSSHYVYLSNDSKGFLWISSMNGIYRFDGISLKAYHSSNSDFIGSIITSPTFEDENKNLWFTSYQALHQYRRKEEVFKPYQYTRSSGDTIYEDYHAFHLQHRQQRLWLKAGESIFTLDIGTPTIKAEIPVSTYSFRFAVDTSQTGKVERIYGVIGLNSGLELFTRDSLDNWEKTDYQLSLEVKGRRDSLKFYDALISNDSIVWLLSFRNGMVRFNRLAPYRIIVPILPPGQTELLSQKAIWYDDKHILVATQDQGLFLFDTEREEFVKNWQHNQNTPYSLTTNNLLGLHQDEQKNLWVGYENGVDFSSEMKRSKKNSILKLNIDHSKASSILEDSLGRIWIRTQDHGLYLLNQTGTVLKKFTFNSILSGLDNLQDMALDHKGKIWCISRKAIFFYEEKSQIWMKVLESSMELLFIRALSGGEKFISTSKGLMSLDFSNGKYNLNPVKGLEEFEGTIFTRIFEHDNGTILIPYRSQELLTCKIENRELKVYGRYPLNAEVFCISERTASDSIWLGTSMGLMLLNDSLQEEPYLKKDWELGYNSIHNIQIDANGKCWLATNDGIWRYDTKNKELVRFGKEDGFENQNFSFNTSLLSSDRKLWIGHGNGVIVFNPDSLSPYNYPPIPYIEEVLINNHPYKLAAYLGEKNSISLKYFENNIVIRPMAIGYHYPALNRFRYLLRGHSQKWGVIGNSDMISLNNLSPGKYELVLVAINKNGIESKERNILKIEIRPAFWNTWWFRLLAIIIIGGIVYINFRLYLRRKLREQQALYNQRRKIADDLHDELGRELSDISSECRNILEGEESNIKNKLIVILEHADRSLNKMEEVLWILDNDVDILRNLIDKIEKDIRVYLSRKNIDLKFAIKNTLPEVELGGKFRSNLLRISKEAIHNVVKHAEASQVMVNISIDNADLIIEIIDNGQGSRGNEREFKGRGMRTMAKRTNELRGELHWESQKNQGTAIRARLPLPR